MLDELIRKHIRPFLRRPDVTRWMWRGFYATVFPASILWWTTGGYLSPIFWLACVPVEVIVMLAILRLDPGPSA